MASINLGEAAQKLLRRGDKRAQIQELVEALGLDIIDVDENLALDAAEIRERGRAHGLSQADCVCIALGKREQIPAMTGDRKWLELAELLDVEIQLIR